ncbi:methionine biosynthesis protein MetW [Dehalogenimonas etheniformans]|uniref:Methionine biosynthesis protein MetW n=1 Tax=Dehalogenimonas etheniformans TaxID=1536648 RepID=A0A2P5P7Y8_9CHLR|nr:methionine biosynthesis protein MetW [Dehalogenimonas etheniformans]PPD58404.1 methionine biosynthesis protein MetW [Dehalogenimonas etheniformans]QNT76978.1 methionine biosynthesis protein MetW [Dehalogenimonas etheniformans]
MSAITKDHEVIAGLITPGSSVLDLGCGEGELMAYLAERRQVKVRGVEIAEPAIYSCVGRGLSVSHQDIDNGLSDYGDKSFDCVILNQCLQQVKSPQTVLAEAVRVGKKAIVGVSNFAHISARWQLGVVGRAPVTPALPFQWFDSPNLHFLSLSDFHNYCRDNGIMIEKVIYLNKESKVRLLPNIFAQTGIFLISNKKIENA